MPVFHTSLLKTVAHVLNKISCYKKNSCQELKRLGGDKHWFVSRIRYRQTHMLSDQQKACFNTVSVVKMQKQLQLWEYFSCKNESRDSFINCTML